MVPASKEFLKEFSLIRFNTILVISFLYFILQMLTSHITHSLILQIDAYHMLYNILSIISCILTVKLGRKGTSLKNTFGWTRINIIGSVAGQVFLAALIFSVVVECLQTIFHASHHDKMHNPIPVLIVGFVGLIVNGICFVTIGGFTFHQSSLIMGTKNPIGDDVIISESVQAYVKRGIKNRKRQGFKEIFRDAFGSVFVIICGTAYYFWDEEQEEEVTKLSDYLDPSLTILTAIILIFLSIPYAKGAARILLLTIPDHINVKNLVKELHQSFPEVVNIHEFHVWELTPTKIIATLHLVLRDTQGYLAIQNNIIDFLNNKGISKVTLQPEFLHSNCGNKHDLLTLKRKCWFPCEEDCFEKQCCCHEQTALSPCGSHMPIDEEFDDAQDDAHEVLSSSSPEPSYTYKPIRVKDDDEDINRDLTETELHPMI